MPDCIYTPCISLYSPCNGARNGRNERPLSLYGMQKLIYKIGKSSEEEHLALDFWDGLSRTVEERISLGFVPLKLPVIDDVPYRIFETMQEYRKRAERTLAPGIIIEMIERAKKLAEILKKYNVEYLVIGKFGAILYGYPGTTQDIDIFPEKEKSNCESS